MFLVKIENIIKNTEYYELLKLEHDELNNYVVSKIMEPTYDQIRDAYGELTPREKLSYCGRILNSDELYFVCNDCATDATCVLCYDCFFNSEHVKHRYKFYTSGGTGSCDCGDVEAWKRFPSCSLHSSSKIDFMSDSCPVANKYCELFAEVFEAACSSVFFWSTTTENAPNYIKSEISFENYALALLNDELHSFNLATATILNVLNCSSAQATKIANNIDSHGKVFISVGNVRKCKKLASFIRTNSRNRNGPLKTEIIHVAVATFQQLAIVSLIHLVEYLEKFGYLEHVCQKIAMESDNLNIFIRPLLSKNTLLWRDVRVTFHKILFSMIRFNSANKLEFARIFTKLYPTIFEHYVTVEGEEENSIIHENVQIYTVPSIVKTLILEDDLLHVLFKTTVTHLSTLVENKFSVSSMLFLDSGAEYSGDIHPMINRIYYSVRSINYVLKNTFDKLDFTDNFREKVLIGFEDFLSLISIFQRINAVIKRTKTHVSTQSRWEEAFVMIINIYNVFDNFLLLLRNDEKTLTNAFLMVKCRILDYLNSHNQVLTENEFRDHKFCVVNIYSDKHMSFNSPLTHIFPLFVTLFYSLNISADIFGDCQNLTPRLLMGPSLEALLFYLEVTAGMWKLNGLSIENQAHHYSSRPMCRNMGNLDIMMLQLCASFMSPDDFICTLLIKLKVSRFLRPNQVDDTGDKHRIEYANNFMRILVRMQLDRYEPGLSEATEFDIMRYVIVNSLAGNISRYNNIINHFQNLKYKRESDIEDVLHEVANLCTKDKEQKYYELKDEYWEMYNPYFYSWGQIENATAKNNFSRKKKSIGKSFGTFFPSKIPRFSGVFCNLTDLLTCRIFTDLIKQEVELLNSQTASESLIEYFLHLISISIIDHENTSSDYPHSEIMNLLQPIVSHVANFHEEVSELFYYVLNKLKNLAYETQIPSDTCLSLDRNRSKIQRIEQVKHKEMEILKNRRKNALSKILKEYEGDNVGNPLETDPLMVDEKICVVCKEVCHHSLSLSDNYVIMPIYIQKSNVMCQNIESPTNNNFMTWDLPLGTYISSCCHVLHINCLKRYQNSVELTLDIPYKCPLCLRPAISFVPILPLFYFPQLPECKFDFPDWLTSLKTIDPFLYKSVKSQSIVSIVDNIKMFFQTVSNYFVDDDSFPRCTWNSIAYTIRSLDNLMTFDGNSLQNSNELYWREYDCINTCLKASSVLITIIPDQVIEKDCARLLYFLLGDSDLQDSIIDVDVFHLLVNIVLSSSFQPLLKGHSHIFRLLLLLHLIQLFLTHSILGPTEEHVVDSQCSCVFPGIKLKLSNEKTEEYLLEGSFSFVRCSAIFFTCMSDVNPKTLSSYNLCGTVDIINYLLGSSYSSILEFFESNYHNILEFSDKWSNQHNLSPISHTRYPLTVRTLVPLNDSFVDLYYNCYHNRCLHDSTVNIKRVFIPAICLICGNYVCITCPKSMNILNSHSSCCSPSSYLIVFDVQNCQLALIGKKIYYVNHSLYIDKYGDTDIGLENHNLMTFSSYQCYKFTRMWLNHSIITDLLQSAMDTSDLFII